MLFSEALVSLLSFGAVALASPVLNLRQTTEPGAWCDGLGSGAFDNASGFTLAAYNTSLPNSNSTGAPIVLGQAGAIVGASFNVFSTYASYPYNDFPSLSLVDGGLIPHSLHGAPSSNEDVQEGTAPSFIVTSQNLPPPAQVYCAVPSTSGGYPVLALHGDTDSFQLCKSGNWANAQTNVIWKPSASGYGYLYDTCYPVKLHIVGL